MLLAVLNSAFRNCKSLKNITITGKVKKVGFNAFAGCNKALTK
jgi:hypothetical protein